MKENFYIVINSLNKGGAERIAAEFGFYLVERGYRPVYFLTDGYSVDYKIPKEASVRALPMSNLSRGALSFLFVLIIQSIYMFFSVPNGAKCISFLHRASIVNGLSCLFKRRRLVVSERSIFSSSYSGFKRFIIWLLLKLVFYKADSIIAISNIVKDELIDSFGGKLDRMVVVNNPINASLFPCKDLSGLIGKDGFKFCYVGRLVDSKRVDLLISFFKDIKGLLDNASLEIIGDGVSRNNLNELVDGLGLNGCVKFSGNVEDVGLYLRKNDIFIFASEYESFGNVALEAISSGLPVIYTENLLSFDEIFSGTNSLALSIPEKVDNDVLEKIKEFITIYNSDSFFSEREELLARFSRESIFSRYMEQVLG